MRVLARLLALAAALLVALPAGALPAVYYCRWMGETMSSCCCRGKQAKAEVPPTDDEVRRSPCCELVPASDATVPGTREAPVRIDVAAIVGRVPIEPVVEVASRVVSSTPAQARAPPGVGPPVFLANCSLLI